MSNVNIEGIILSRVNYGEADRILTVFSREQGKIKVIAKGSRKIKSKLAPHIEPFCVGNYYLAQGRSLYILAGAESTEQNEEILSDLDIYQDACYVSELLSMTIYEDVVQTGLYDTAKEIYLNLPNYESAQRETILHYFEYKLLETAGYTPNFHRCGHCGKELAEQDVYEGSFEGVNCDGCGTGEQKVSKMTVKIMRLFAENKLSGVLRVQGLSDYNHELKDVLQPFLYDILPRTPRAREI